jgi:hypothetical protein
MSERMCLLCSHEAALTCGLQMMCLCLLCGGVYIGTVQCHDIHMHISTSGGRKWCAIHHWRTNVLTTPALQQLSFEVRKSSSVWLNQELCSSVDVGGACGHQMTTLDCHACTRLFAAWPLWTLVGPAQASAVCALAGCCSTRRHHSSECRHGFMARELPCWYHTTMQCGCCRLTRRSSECVVGMPLVSLGWLASTVRQLDAG